jgi:type VII secretion protein EccB
MVGRLVSALLRAEPDMATPPLRRSWSGMLVGLILAVLAVAGFAVFGIISPGGATGWRKPGTLILEKQTGARFVLSGGRLRPILNYASARLLLGAKLTVDSVPSSSIADVPRGGPVGIIGAPDSLPKMSRTAASWLMCATVALDSSAGPRPALSLTIGGDDNARPLSDRQAVLVRTSDGTTYLVTGQRRLRVTAPWVSRALGFPDGGALAVRDAWIDALPAGPDLPQPAVTGLGSAGPVLDGRPTKIGEVFVVHSADQEPHSYVLTARGLQSATPTGAALTLGDPQTARAYGGRTAAAHELSPAALASAHVLPAPDWQTQLPSKQPTVDALTGGRMPCVRAVPGGTVVAVSVVTAPAVPVLTANAVSAPVSKAASGGLADPGRVADAVQVAPRAGLLARTLPASGAPGRGLYLVTEEGAKFPVGSETAATALGYAVSSAVPVPADLLALLPTGPVLQVLGAEGGTG